MWINLSFVTEAEGVNGPVGLTMMVDIILCLDPDILEDSV